MTHPCVLGYLHFLVQFCRSSCTSRAVIADQHKPCQRAAVARNALRAASSRPAGVIGGYSGRSIPDSGSWIPDFGSRAPPKSDARRRHQPRKCQTASGPARNAPPQKAISATTTIVVATPPRPATLKGRNGTPNSPSQRGNDPTMSIHPTVLRRERTAVAAGAGKGFWVMRVTAARPPASK